MPEIERNCGKETIGEQTLNLDFRLLWDSLSEVYVDTIDTLLCGGVLRVQYIDAFAYDIIKKGFDLPMSTKYIDEPHWTPFVLVRGPNFKYGTKACARLYEKVAHQQVFEIISKEKNITGYVLTNPHDTEDIQYAPTQMWTVRMNDKGVKYISCYKIVNGSHKKYGKDMQVGSYSPFCYNFGYTQMCEIFEGMNQYDCPLHLLDLVGPPINSRSKAWRDDVLSYYQMR